MLHKIVETGKVDDKCKNILKYSCYACYEDIFFFLRQTRHADYYHRYYNHRTGMLGTIFGIEIVMIKKNFSFHGKDQGYHLYKFFISQR